MSEWLRKLNYLDKKYGHVDSVELTISGEDYDWLIKQAKRVERLQNKIETLEKQNNELTGIGGMWMSARNKLEESQKQNKRYKQGLERIAYDDEVLSNTDDIVIAIEALRGESNV